MKFMISWAILSLLLLLSIGGCSRSPSIESPNERPFGFVDRPRSGERVGRILELAGWALDDTAVSSVRVFVDGRLKGSFGLTTPRPDVSDAYPQFGSMSAARNHRHGWTATVDIGASPGPHAIKVLAVDERGATSRLTSIVVYLIGRE